MRCYLANGDLKMSLMETYVVKEMHTLGYMIPVDLTVFFYLYTFAVPKVR